MGGFARRFAERQIDDAFDELLSQSRLARRARLVAQQTIDALAHEALLPAPDDRLRQSGLAHDLHRAAAVGGGEDDPGASRVLLRTVVIPDDPIKARAVLGRDVNNNACSHARSMNQISALGNPPNAPVH